MTLASLPRAATHLPYAAGEFRLSLGLTSIAEAGWIDIDEHYPAHLAERRRLLAERRAAVLAETPGSEAMQAELLEVLAGHLCRHHPDWFARRGDAIENRLLGESLPLGGAPLEAAGRLVQEDFCLLREEEDATLRLVAAVLCFPSRWRLADKIGRPLGPIHGPVPLYKDRLKGPVDRFLSSLKAGRLAQRLNWSVMDDAALFQPTGHGVEEGVSPVMPERLVLRVERQTFRRLPRTGGIVFGIRIHVTPLADIATIPGEAARLREAVLALPPEMARYKSIAPFRPALLAWLEGCARAGD